MITIDGSLGEGGGQVLRSALGLSLVTGQAFRITNIRAGRKSPGLLRQHLTAVEAATQVGNASVDGGTLGSKELIFKPAKVRAGAYSFAVGTAGSATLVLQTVMPALMIADQPSQLTLEGGTHNPMAPTYDFLERAFFPILQRMGPKIESELYRAGFYPAGGGKFRVAVQPSAKLRPLTLLERGEIRRRSARAIIANLAPGVAERELKVVQEKMGWNSEWTSVEKVSSPGPGNALIIEVESDSITEVISSFGERGVLAERVAENAVTELRDYLASGAPVGEHLADQLLIPLALAGQGAFLASALSRHTLTNIDVISKFLPAKFTPQKHAPGYLISL